MLRLRQGLLGLCAKNRAFSTFHRRKRKFDANNCDHNDFSIIGVICKLLKMRCALIWVNKPAIFVVIMVVRCMRICKYNARIAFACKDWAIGKSIWNRTHKNYAGS
ncbi:hypothetical protein CSC3H3_11485 [Thalassospira marina]|uniref:Uncharacterized protein n=1 Tax=Thalassospira marina TaxID=2048283 RepID=A0ABM6Q9N6_9PROT|nr:hypothetical protein CSC3H3_11485 [Thalassospira marina]